MTYRAFVASTREDLAAHRARVIAGLQRARMEVDPMEGWGADPEAPHTYSPAQLRGCNLCVLLVGFRRGTVPAGQRYSITQLEYREAVRLGIDGLVYALDDAVTGWPAEYDDRERDPQVERWRAELRSDHVVRKFGSSPASIELEADLAQWVVGTESRRARRFRRSAGEQRRAHAPPLSPRVPVDPSPRRARAHHYLGLLRVERLLRPLLRGDRAGGERQSRRRVAVLQGPAAAARGGTPRPYDVPRLARFSRQSAAAVLHDVGARLGPAGYRLGPFRRALLSGPADLAHRARLTAVEPAHAGQPARRVRACLGNVARRRPRYPTTLTYARVAASSALN